MKWIALIIFFAVPALISAQNREGLRKIESARIALITERLNLTPEQAEKFWPLYREYTEQRRELRREFLATRRSTDTNMTEEQSKALLDKGIQLKERLLELERRYTERLGAVITNQQLLQLRQAEEDFRQMLLERVENRRERRDGLQRRRDSGIED